MGIELLHHGLFLFLFGMILSLPLAVVHYLKKTPLTKLFIKPSKLRSAHIDYFMQAFSLGFVYLIEWAQDKELENYLFILLCYGSFMNPTILLLEATPYIETGIGKGLYNLFRATSPLSLMIVWFSLMFQFLPYIYRVIIVTISLFVGLGLLFSFGEMYNKSNKVDKIKE
ncbi:hypothetical protein ABK040_003277 [Willaertia magna]